MQATRQYNQQRLSPKRGQATYGSPPHELLPRSMPGPFPTLRKSRSSGWRIKHAHNEREPVADVNRRPMQKRQRALFLLSPILEHHGQGLPFFHGRFEHIFHARLLREICGKRLRPVGKCLITRDVGMHGFICDEHIAAPVENKHRLFHKADKRLEEFRRR